MWSSWRRYGIIALATTLMTSPTAAQTWSECNPLHTSNCPANAALGMTIDVDFTKGAVNSFSESGSPTYSDEGASFTVAKGGDAPQINSLFTIMFGRVEVTMKAAPGAGIVSSLVLESDTLDEIDIEWLGSNPEEMQSNYFGKGQTTTYNRGEFHQVANTQTNWITYTVDWTKDRILWIADGTVVRTLNAADAEENQYPQTPMQVKLGAWAGGDPSYNPPGTVEWARGPTDYTNGPFTMLVQRISITDYSTGSKYRYTDNSGSWESIESEGGEINGNIDNEDAVTVTATASGTAVTSGVSVPVGGFGSNEDSTATRTGWPWDGTSDPTDAPIPDGWTMTSEGKLLPSATSTLRPLSPLLAVVLVVLPLALLRWLP